MSTEPIILPSEQENPTGLIRKYTSAVDKLSRLAFTTHTPEGLLESFVDLIKDLLHVEKASVMLLDPVTESLNMKVFRGGTLTEGEKYNLKPGEGITGQVLLRKEPILLAGQDNSSQYYTLSPDEPAAALYIPLVVGHEARGIITLGSAGQQQPFTADEVKLAFRSESRSDYD